MCSERQATSSCASPAASASSSMSISCTSSTPVHTMHTPVRTMHAPCMYHARIMHAPCMRHTCTPWTGPTATIPRLRHRTDHRTDQGTTGRRRTARRQRGVASSQQPCALRVVPVVQYGREQVRVVRLVTPLSTLGPRAEEVERLVRVKVGVRVRVRVRVRVQLRLRLRRRVRSTRLTAVRTRSATLGGT